MRDRRDIKDCWVVHLMVGVAWTSVGTGRAWRLQAGSRHCVVLGALSQPWVTPCWTWVWQAGCVACRWSARPPQSAHLQGRVQCATSSHDSCRLLLRFCGDREGTALACHRLPGLSSGAHCSVSRATEVAVGGSRRQLCSASSLARNSVGPGAHPRIPYVCPVLRMVRVALRAGSPSG